MNHEIICFLISEQIDRKFFYIISWKDYRIIFLILNVLNLNISKMDCNVNNDANWNSISKLGIRNKNILLQNMF